MSFTPQIGIKNQNKTMKTTTNSRRAGFTLVEIMIVVAIIGLLASIAIPNYVRARATSQQSACINNLRLIDGAINEWALETGQASGAVVASVTTVSAYIKLNSNNSVPGCPAGGSYTTTAVGNGRQVSCSMSTLAMSPHIVP
jgi:prepilin-type N-terminal cleavage/methylation domain-containing protein